LSSDLMLVVFYGTGKGKTTAALGTLFRFLGYDGSALVLQFMKDCSSGEYELYRKLVRYGFKVKWYCLGTNEFVDPYDLGNEVASLVMAKSVGFLLHVFPDVFNELKPRLVLFDELGLAVHMSIIPTEIALKTLTAFQGSSEYHAIVTGRYVPKELKEVADLITKFSEVKHYFREGHVNIRGLDV